MQCSNKLKQLALACHNYHDTYKSFPSGYLVKRTAPTPTAAIQIDKAMWSWGALVGRFIEGNAQIDTMNVGNTWLDNNGTADALATHAGQTTEILTTTNANFRCPSDVGPATNSQRPLDNGTAYNTSTSNYVAANSAFDISQNGGTGAANGLFRQDNAMSFRDMTDGSSNVIALGERRWYIRDTAGNATDVGAANAWGIRDLGANPVTNLDVLADALAGGGCTINNKADQTLSTHKRRGFSSQHPGGALFALGDGSVRFIGETIATTGFTSAGINDQLVVDSPFEYLLGIQDGNPVGDY
jgi:hypothetical protein